MDDNKEKERQKIAEEHGIGREPAQNPNPRANENVPDGDNNPKPDSSATDKPGSEITDGGAG